MCVEMLLTPRKEHHLNCECVLSNRNFLTIFHLFDFSTQNHLGCRSLSQLFVTWAKPNTTKSTWTTQKNANALTTKANKNGFFYVAYKQIRLRVWVLRSVRVSSNIYFNSIEEIPYSHCPIKVLKFNIYTYDYRKCTWFGDPSLTHSRAAYHTGPKIESMYRSKLKLEAITIIRMTNRISK